MPMRILIAERLRPFSSRPGVWMPLPGSSQVLQVFPSKFVVYDRSQKEALYLGEAVFDLKEVARFTAQLDLEKGRIGVWGEGKEGYFRYLISSAGENGVIIKKEKGDFSWDSSLNVPDTAVPYEAPKDLIRLSLGNHKKQDWDLVQRRLDFTEILPVWNALSQQVFAPQPVRKLELDDAPEKIVPNLLQFYLTHFSGIMAPHLEDRNFHRFSTPAFESESPFSLIVEGAAAFRRLLIAQQGNEIAFLPKLPPEFHCGRMVDFPAEGLGRVDFEWSKKWLKRVAVYPESDAEVSFHLQDGLKRFRVRRSKQDEGYIAERGSPIRFSRGNRYILDNFER